MCFQILQIAQVTIGSDGIGFRQVKGILYNEIGIVGIGMVSNIKARRILYMLEIGQIDLFQVFCASNMLYFGGMLQWIPGGPG